MHTTTKDFICTPHATLGSLLLFTALMFATSASAADIAVRLLYMQGFRSCGLIVQEPVSTFHDKLAALMAKNPEHGRLDYRTHSFCFDAGIYDHFSDSYEYLQQGQVSQTGVWSKMNRTNIATAPQDIRKMLEDEARSLQEQGFEMPMRVFMIGHSHGGWLAMRTAAELGSSELVQIESLLTLDPISYNLCASMTYAWRLVNTVPSGIPTAPDGCHEAPRDLIPLIPSIQNATAGKWENYYQTKMTYLHSGPIVGADDNIDFPESGAINYLYAHRAILIDPRTRLSFMNRVVESISNARSP